MSENTPSPPELQDTHTLNLNLEALKFVYKSCSRSIMELDFEHSIHSESVEQLKTCVYLFEELERLDPDWLVENGLTFKKSFHLSWIHWIQALTK